MARRLRAEERALWEKVIATTRPLQPAERSAPPEEPEEAAPEVPPRSPARIKASSPPARRPAVRETLDAGWDRRLSRGLVQPDLSIDLHGHNLHAAYRLLDEGLERAVARGARVLLLVTGHAPKGEAPVTRGKIRAAVGDWLAASRHAGDIAAVRSASPRHGGAGALYIVLRRRR